MRQDRHRSRLPGSAVAWLLSAVAVLTTFVSVVLATPEPDTWERAATTATLLILPAALACSALACTAWHLSPRPGVAWLSAATAMVGIQGLPMLAVGPQATLSGGPELLPSSLVVGLALLVVIKAASALSLPVAPIPLGFGIGLLLLVIRSSWPSDFTFVDSGASTQAGGIAVLLTLALATSVALVRATRLPLGSVRLAAAIIAWSVAAALSSVGLTVHAPWAVLVTVAGLTASTLTVTVGLDLLRLSMYDDHEALSHLQQEVLILRDRAREGVEQLHEVKGTIAGIASASDLILVEDQLPVQDRQRLKEMLAREAARLRRLVHAESRMQHRISDVDEILRPLVMAHRIQGHDVTWTPPDLPLLADRDMLTEVVNILLHNASEHAPGAHVEIFTRVQQDRVELVVADEGDGVPSLLRDRVFDWGFSGRGSRGQGVGLAMARDLVSGCGGHLRLEPGASRGAAFVIELPSLGTPDQGDLHAGPAAIAI